MHFLLIFIYFVKELGSIMVLHFDLLRDDSNSDLLIGGETSYKLMSCASLFGAGSYPCRDDYKTRV